MGVSLLSDPFPVRADGSRFESPYRNALGAMMVAGTNYTYGNLQFQTRQCPSLENRRPKRTGFEYGD